MSLFTNLCINVGREGKGHKWHVNWVSYSLQMRSYLKNLMFLSFLNKAGS